MAYTHQPEHGFHNQIDQPNGGFEKRDQRAQDIRGRERNLFRVTLSHGFWRHLGENQYKKGQ
jgi:hypothetical protein